MQGDLRNPPTLPISRGRVKKRRIPTRDIWTECIGYSAILGWLVERYAPEPYEVRLRVAAKVDTERDARI